MIVIGFGSITGCKKNYYTTGADSVIHSPWIVLQMTYAGKDANSDSTFGEVLTAPSVTQSIIDKGVVLTYIAQGVTSGGDTVISSADNILNPYLYVGKVDLLSVGDYSGTPFRYVIIPGSIAATSFPNMTLQQIKALPFQEVTKILNTAGKSASPAKLN